MATDFIYVPIFTDWLENTQDLSAEEKGHLIDALIMYVSDIDTCADQLKTSAEKTAFRFMKGQIDRNKSISKKRGIAGSTIKAESNDEQNESNDIKTEQRKSNLPKEIKKEKENKKQNIKQNISPLFDRFWNAYPRHVNKQGAIKAFNKANIDSEMLETILAAIERQKASDQWTKDNGQFIPHPATWLNQRRWEDEIRPAERKQIKTVVAQQYEQRDYSGEQDEAMERMIKTWGETG